MSCRTRTRGALSLSGLAIALVIGACATAPPPTPPPPSGAQVGARTVGTTAYAVPTGAKFVSPSGRDTALGLQAAPWKTVAHAIAVSPSGTTIVLRAGTYPENVLIPAGKALTIQPYPNEAAWFKGSTTVTGWIGDGGDWRKDGWTTRFSRAGIDPKLIDPAYPLAAYPDLAFIDGAPLRQVGKRAGVVPGTFFVDEAASRLWIGSNPAGRKVEAAVVAEALNVKGAGSVIRGIGFKHFATHVSRHGAVKAGARGVSFENDVFSDNAAGGLSLTSTDVKIRYVTATGNGQLGIVTDRSDRMFVDSSIVSKNNIEHFFAGSAAGGLKLTLTKDATVRGSRFDDNIGHGLWFDLESDRGKIVRNIARRNLYGAGIMFEYSTGGILAGNIVTDNTVGILAGESSNVAVWNNTFVNNQTAFKAYDGYRAPVPVGITVRNNIFSSRSFSTRPVLICEDVTGKRTYKNMRWSSDSNAFYRQSTGITPYAEALANWPAPKLTYNTVAAVKASTGFESRSLSVDNTGTDPYVADYVRGNYARPSGSPARGRGTPLPADVAAVLGRPAGQVVDMGAI